MTFEVKSLRNTTHTVPVTFPTADHLVALEVDVALAVAEEVSEKEEEADAAIHPTVEHIPTSPISLPFQRTRSDMSTGARIRIMQVRNLMMTNTLLMLSLQSMMLLPLGSAQSLLLHQSLRPLTKMKISRIVILPLLTTTFDDKENSPLSVVLTDENGQPTIDKN